MGQLNGRTAYDILGKFVPGGLLLLGLVPLLFEPSTPNVVELTGLLVGGFFAGGVLQTVSHHVERRVHRQQNPLRRVVREHAPDLESLSAALAEFVSAFVGYLYVRIGRAVVEYVAFVLFLFGDEDEEP